MTIKLPKSEWDKVAEEWNTEAGNTGIWHQRHDIDPVIFELLKNLKNKKIIEIGCGNGYFARLLAKKDIKVTAVDLSANLVAYAIEREKTEPLGIKYFVRDAANLYGIKSNSFDIAVANMSLMDITDAEKAIKEVSRVLKKNGKFVLSITHPIYCDFQQQWIIIKENGKKYFARAISKYLSSVTKKRTLLTSGIKITQYHRSIETYFKYLRNADLLISDFKEIATNKPVTKAKKEDKNVKFRRSKYLTLSEKKMKKFAGKEIPLFLIMVALKI